MGKNGKEMLPPAGSMLNYSSIFNLENSFHLGGFLWIHKPLQIAQQPYLRESRWRRAVRNKNESEWPNKGRKSKALQH